MRNLLALTATLVFLTGCDESPPEIEDASSTAENSDFVLSCTGTSPSLEGVKETTKLIWVPSLGSSEQLSQWNEDEKMWWELCASATFQCQTEVGPDIIRQTGTPKGDFGPMSVVINRRTGTIVEQYGASGGLSVKAFEGACEPGEAPAETPRMF